MHHTTYITHRYSIFWYMLPCLSKKGLCLMSYFFITKTVYSKDPDRQTDRQTDRHYNLLIPQQRSNARNIQPESPARGLRSSPPACTASLVVGSSKAPWPWPWPWGHINIHSICKTTSVPNRVTVASPSTEICGNLNVVKYRQTAKFELSWQLS